MGKPSLFFPQICKSYTICEIVYIERHLGWAKKLYTILTLHAILYIAGNRYHSDEIGAVTSCSVKFMSMYHIETILSAENSAGVFLSEKNMGNDSSFTV